MAGVVVAAGLLSAAALPPTASMVQTTAPIGSVSPSLANVFKTPAFSAVSSNVALSDSSSAMASSIATVSPSFFIHRESVTSVMDSPTVGTLTCKEVAVAVGGVAVAVAVAGWAATGAVSLLPLPPATATGAAEGAPPSSIVATTAPIGKVSPSFAAVFNIPAFSAVSSKVALSDSNSAITSSISTLSPSFFFQLERVTSVIDSPTGGTLIVKLILLW